MLARLRSAVLTSLVLIAPWSLEASPITYDFTATLNEPVNGSNQMSGSFTIDGNATLNSSNTLVETGTAVSLTVNMGGQTIQFVNSSQSSNGVSLIGGLEPIAEPGTSATTIPVGLGGNGGASPNPATWYQLIGTSNGQSVFNLWFTRAGTPLPLTDLASLNSPSFTSQFYVSDGFLGQSEILYGTLSSIEEMATPEPSTLAVFGVIGIAAMARRRKSQP